MSRKGDCWDHSVAESFFSTAKSELGIDKPVTSVHVAEMMLAEYIDDFYNQIRLHQTIRYKSPVAYELRSVTSALAA